MTREEAISVLKETIDPNIDKSFMEWKEWDKEKHLPAVNMAIDALQALQGKSIWNGAEWNGKERTMKRGEAIRILTEIQTKHKKYIGQTECNNALNMAIEALQAEPKRGTWTITHKDDGEVGEIQHLICSECKSEPIAWSSKRFFNYCPNCGAKMKID